MGTADGLERMLGYPSIGPGIAIARKALPKMPAHLAQSRIDELSGPTSQGAIGMDVAETDHSADANEKRRRLASQPLPPPERSAEALDIVERERTRKYNKAIAERQEILATIEAIQRRNTAADLFFAVNAKIYIDEAAKLGTNLTVEVFEPVLDEEGDVKNMVMYMVAETIGDLPLEVKWWTGRMDDNNKPIREEGEMAIADWGELHRNTFMQFQTKNRCMTQPSTKDTNTLYSTTLPHQVLATGPPEQESERNLLQRSRGGRNVQKTESREGEQAEGQDEQQEQRKGHPAHQRKGGQLFTGDNKPLTEPKTTKPGHKTQTHPARTHTTPTHPNPTSHTIPHPNPTRNITTQHNQTQHNPPQLTQTPPTLSHIITPCRITTNPNILPGALSAPRRFRDSVELGTLAIRGSKKWHQPCSLQSRQTHVIGQPAGAHLEVIYIDSIRQDMTQHPLHQHTPSHHILNQHTPPQHTRSQHTPPQHILTQHTLPQHIPTQHTLPQHIPPQHIPQQRPGSETGGSLRCMGFFVACEVV